MSAIQSAIQAEFVNFRNVPSRKVTQLILEVPQESLMHVLEALGLPRTEESLWVAVAPLVEREQAAE